MRLQGKRALITGAASGIGRETALLAAREGASVACIDLALDAARAVAAEAEKAGAESLAIACDITDSAAVKEAVARTADTFGGLDSLFNVAGTGSMQHTHEVSEAEWRRIIDVNLTGTFLVTQTALPLLLAQKGSSISTVASVAGLNGQAYTAAYCASKFGVVGLMKSIAIEYASQGLRANCVCPAAVKTPLMGSFGPPEGADIELVKRLSLVTKFCHPEEIAEALVFLAADTGRTLNGLAIPMDFGLTAS